MQIPCAKKGQILFCKKPLILPKSSLKLISSNMLEVLIGNILYIWYVWWTYLSTNSRHTYGWKLCSCSCRLVPLFKWDRLHTRASREKEKKLARSFNFTFRYIDDVLSLNNSSFGDFVDCIYPIELEIKDAIDTDRSPSYFDLLLGYVPLVVNVPGPFPIHALSPDL